MRKLRQFHTLVGCFTAPLIVMLAVSGAWQAFNFHKAAKDGSYRPWSLVAAVSKFHQNEYFRPNREAREACAKIEDKNESQRCLDDAKRAADSLAIRRNVLGGLLVAVAGGILINALTGLWMAMQVKRMRIAAIALSALGIAVPIALAYS
ncbi:MAG: hypothetical protein HY287_04625 [Planctomycetes bacterium]|nr:hypothetical protein [Planctomycetota bacterium]MBI3833599.1 hypothetical protein [Planctomycetota bacterium]